MAMVATAPGRSRWLFGPAPDLLLGCGLLYVLLFAAFVLAGPGIRSVHPAFLLPLLTLAFSTPHYGATLLRVYERREDRRGYYLFSVWATLAIFVAFAVGSHAKGVAVFMVTLYLTWSPWHYTGQNYGIGVLFLRRRGVEVTPVLKRLLYSSFILSYAVVLLVMHTGGGVAADVPVPYAQRGVAFQSLGIPARFSAVVVPILVLGYVASLAGWVGMLLRRSTWREAAPALVLASTQALWFSLPFALWHWGLVTGIEAIDREQRTYYFLWIALGHAVQYLWVTAYYARGSPGHRGLARYWIKALAAGAAVWTLPVILFGPEWLGGRDYDGGLALLVASAVNLHHFVLDGAIWKLRNHRIASVLIRSVPVEWESASAAPAAAWSRRLVWTAAAGGLAASLFVFAQTQLASSSAVRQGDLDAAAQRLDRLAWFGRDSARDRRLLAEAYVARGDEARAVAQYERSVALRPTVDAYSGLVQVRGSRDDWTAAVAVFERALEMLPDDPELRFRTGVAWMHLNRPDRAREHLERAAEIRPNSLRIRRKLDRVRLLLAGGVASPG